MKQLTIFSAFILIVISFGSCEVGHYSPAETYVKTIAQKQLDSAKFEIEQMRFIDSINRK